VSPPVDKKEKKEKKKKEQLGHNSKIPASRVSVLR
jgi:hypothetical protein